MIDHFWFQSTDAIHASNKIKGPRTNDQESPQINAAKGVLTVEMQITTKEKNHSRLHHFIILTIFWIVLIIYINPFGNKNLQYNAFQSIGSLHNVAPTNTFSQGVSITQEFIAQSNGFKKLEILLATYSRPNTALFTLTVQEKNGHVICREVVDSSKLSDNSFYPLVFSPQLSSKGKTYQICIEGMDGESNNSPSAWLSDADNDIEVVINGEPMKYSLIMQLTYEAHGLYVVCLILSILASLGLIIVMRRANGKSFLCICLCIGLLFVFMISFVNPIDEITHFFKSYLLSSFRMETIEDGQIGNYMSSSLYDLLSVSYRRFGINRNFRFFSQPFNEETNFYSNPYAASIIPINHCVAAIGLAIANLLHMSIGWTVIMGRLANFAFYVFVCYHAIRKVKHYKSLFFTVACLPAAIWLAAAYSTDPVLLAASLMFLAICFSYRFDGVRQIKKSDMAILLLCCVSISSVKYMVYSPLLLCFFLIPKECFEKKQRRWMVVSAIIIMCALLVWQLLLLKRFPFAEDRNGDVNLMRQIQFVFSNIGFAIKNFLDYFLNSMFTHMQSMYIYSSITSVSSCLSVLCLLSAVIATDKKECSLVESKWLKIVFASIASIITALIIVSLYAAFTPVGSYGVQGIQTRYFLPVLVPFMMVLAMSNIRNHNKNHEEALVTLVEFSLLLSLTGTIINTFSG